MATTTMDPRQYYAAQQQQQQMMQQQMQALSLQQGRAAAASSAQQRQSQLQMPRPGQDPAVAAQRQFNASGRAAQSRGAPLPPAVFMPAAAPGDAAIHYGGGYAPDMMPMEGYGGEQEFGMTTEGPPPDEFLGMDDNDEFGVEDSGIVEELGATAARPSGAGPHNDYMHHDHKRVRLYGSLKLPSSSATADNFTAFVEAKEGVALANTVHASVKNGMLTPSSDSDPTIIDQLRSGEVFIVKAAICEADNDTEQFIELSINTGEASIHSHSVCALRPKACKYDHQIIDAAFEPKVKEMLDEMKITTVKQLKAHAEVVGGDVVLVKRTGDAENAARVIQDLYAEEFGMLLLPTSDTQLTLQRGDFDRLIEKFSHWSKQSAMPVSHEHFAVKIHRLSVGEYVAPVKPGHQWLSRLGGASSNTLSYILELVVVPGSTTLSPAAAAAPSK